MDENISGFPVWFPNKLRAVIAEMERSRLVNVCPGYGYVYFVQSLQTGAVKIGQSQDPEARVLSFKTGNDTALMLLGVMPGGADVERDLHAEFAEYRIQREWFLPVNPILCLARHAHVGVRAPDTRRVAGRCVRKADVAPTMLPPGYDPTAPAWAGLDVVAYSEEG